MNIDSFLISQAKRAAPYGKMSASERLHEHDDCVRIAYAFLDAQRKNTKANSRRYLPLKTMIERWGGRYVSEADVLLAAYLHPGVRGDYPAFNLPARLVVPSFARLDGISEAMAHPDYRSRLWLFVRDGLFLGGFECRADQAVLDRGEKSIC